MKRDSSLRPQDLTQTQPISHDVLAEKYLKPGETGVEDLYRRVARALASVEKEADRAEWEDRDSGHAHQLLRAAGGRLHPGRG
jgi:ribonucleoside-diphosphate reductase alpha chain